MDGSGEIEFDELGSPEKGWEKRSERGFVEVRRCPPKRLEAFLFNIGMFFYLHEFSSM